MARCVPQAAVLVAPWCRLRVLAEYPVGTVRPLYNPSTTLAKTWLDFAELLLKENRSDNMVRAAQYLVKIATNSLETEGLVAMPWHTGPPSEAELTLERLAQVPKSTRQRLPAAVFSCTIHRV